MSPASSIESAMPPESGSRLSQDDVRRLLEEPTIDAKIDVLEKVTRQYSPDMLSASEMQLAEQIFRLLVRDSAIRIRRAMAENLQDNPHIPHDIALTLAQDLESVATPILTMSQVLEEKDLLTIIHQTEEIWRYTAIARREGLPRHVSGALVETDVPDVIKELLDNDSAEISDASFARIAEHARTDEEVVYRLTRRAILPVTVAEKLTHYVSDDILRQLKARCAIDDEQLEAGARHAEEGSTLGLLSAQQDRQQTQLLVEQLYGSGRLTSSLIINALCQGNLDFFEMSLARLANIPTENAHILISDPGRLGFRALYNKSQLPATMYKAVRLLLDSVRHVLDQGVKGGSHHFANMVVHRMIETAQEEHVENLSYVLAIIRQPQPVNT